MAIAASTVAARSAVMPVFLTPVLTVVVIVILHPGTIMPWSIISRSITAFTASIVSAFVHVRPVTPTAAIAITVATKSITLCDMSAPAFKPALAPSIASSSMTLSDNRKKQQPDRK